MSKEEYPNFKILYVEDEDFIRANATSYLKRLFKNVFCAKDAFEAIKIIKEDRPHIVITDIKMPKLSGLDMIRQIRKDDTKTQFIVLSAFTDTKYLLDAIDLGLVKYLSKPIRHEIIYPLLINCANNIFKTNEAKFNLSKDCYFDLANEILYVNKEEIKVSKNELDFLILLFKNRQRVVTYEELQNHIWYDEYMSDNAIRLLVRDLRKKLPKNSIKNISKIGYKIELLK